MGVHLFGTHKHVVNQWRVNADIKNFADFTRKHLQWFSDVSRSLEKED